MTKSAIPIQNMYFLLAYAWDHFRAGEQIDVDQSQCPDVHNLLAMLLSNGIRGLATRGIDKDYLPFVEETPRLRGRIQLLPSYRRLTHASGRMICEFDELTADTLPNQILKATCNRLVQQSSDLTPDIRADVHHAFDLLGDISLVRLTGRSFHRIQLHRNNRHYRLLLHVCQLLHDLYLPSQQSGKRRFQSLLDDQITMHRVFETFVRQFAIRHCPDAKISAMHIKWDADWDDDEVAKVIPTMITDVTIERATKKTILDCKYYRNALVTRDGRQRLHSDHLYQLTAYLQNKSLDAGWENVNGILLYPAVDHHLKLEFKLLGHDIEIQSLDLDQPWRSIHNRLLAILTP